MHLRNTKQFFCPQCQEPVQLKIGQVMIPHFAHLQKSRCRNSFSEGETADHLLGKHLLYEMFQKFRLTVHLEPYLPHLGQRPDIFVEFNQQQFAIEFQCSTIPIPQIENRTAGLEEKGYGFHVTASDVIHEFSKRYPLLVQNKQAINSLNSYTEILKKLNVAKINSIYDEKMLYQYIYVQFLAKR